MELYTTVFLVVIMLAFTALDIILLVLVYKCGHEKLNNL